MAVTDRGQDISALYQELRQGRIRPLYLCYGDEEFLVSKAAEAVQATVLKGIPKDFNYNIYYGKECDPQRVIDSAMTLPMMAPRRLVVLKDAQEIKESGLERLVRYAERPSPSTVLLMVGTAMGNRRKLVGAVKKNGLVLELRTLYERQLKAWVRAEINELGKSIGEDGVDLLIDMVGENLRELNSELLKVSLYVGNREKITIDDLQAILSDVSLDTVFEFTNAVGAKELGKALLQLSKMLENDKDASGSSILAMLQRHFRQLYRTRLLLNERLSNQEIARRVGVRENMVWKWEKEMLPQARARTRRDLAHALKLLYQTTVDLRSRRAPEQFQLEFLVTQLCR